MRPNAFPRKHRLLESHQFQSVFRQAKFRSSRNCFLLLAIENHLDYPRLGLVVGRRKAKRSVDRSLIKRLARESFRLRTAELSGLDIIVLLRHPPSSFDPVLLRFELNQAWQGLLAKRYEA